MRSVAFGFAVASLVAIAFACGGKETPDGPISTIDPGTYAATEPDGAPATTACVIPTVFEPSDASNGGDARGSCETATFSLTGACVGEGPIFGIVCTGDSTPDPSFGCTLLTTATPAREWCCPCGQ